MQVHLLTYFKFTASDFAHFGVFFFLLFTNNVCTRHRLRPWVFVVYVPVRHPRRFCFFHERCAIVSLSRPTSIALSGTRTFDLCPYHAVKAAIDNTSRSKSGFSLPLLPRSRKGWLHDPSEPLISPRLTLPETVHDFESYNDRPFRGHRFRNRSVVTRDNGSRTVSNRF